MITNGRKLGEMARQHGFSEAAVQRLTNTSIESFILDQQSRGKVRLELIDEPPKWTSSPHRGQMYHVVPITPDYRKRSRRKETSNSLAHSKGSRAQSVILNPVHIDGTRSTRQRHYHPNPGLSPFSTNYGNRIFTKRFSILERKHTFSTAAYRNQHAVADTVESAASPGESFPVTACNGELSFKPVGLGIKERTSRSPPLSEASSLDTDIITQCQQFLLKHTGRTLRSNDDIESLSENVLSIALHAGSLSNKVVVQILTDLVLSGHLKLSKVIIRLHDSSSFVLLLQLVQQHHEKLHGDNPSILLAFDSVLILLATPDISNGWLREISLILLNMAASEAWVEPYMKHLEGHANLQIQELFLPHMLALASQQPSRHLPTLAKSLETSKRAKGLDNSRRATKNPHQLRNCLLSSLRTCSSLSEEVFRMTSKFILQNQDDVTLIDGNDPTSMLLKLSAGGFVRPTLDEPISDVIELSLQHKFITFTMRLLEEHQNVLSEEQKSSYAVKLMEQYDQLPIDNIKVHVTRKMVSLCCRGQFKSLADGIPFIVRVISSPELDDGTRSKFWQDVFTALRSDLDYIGNILSHATENKGHESTKTISICKLTHLQDLWEATKNYPKFLARDAMLYKPSQQRSTARMKLMIRVAAHAGDKDLASSTATTLYQHHVAPNQVLDTIPLILSAYAQCGQPDALLEVLDQLWDDKAFFGLSNLDQLNGFYLELIKSIPVEKTLDFIETCFTKYGMGIGPRAFIHLIFRIVGYEKRDSCLHLMERLLLSNSQSPRPIAISDVTMLNTLRAARIRRAGDSGYLFSLIKHMISTQCFPVSNDMCLQALSWVGSDYQGSQKDIDKSSPYILGQHWSPSRHRNHRRMVYRLRVWGVGNALKSRRQFRFRRTGYAFKQDYSAFEKPPETVKDAAASLKCVVQMKSFVAMKRPRSAIREFESYVSSGKVATPGLMDFATRTYIAIHDVARAKQLIKDLSKRSLNPASLSSLEYRLFRWRLHHENLSAEEISSLVKDWYTRHHYDAPDFLHMAGVQAAEHLLRCGNSAAAFRLMEMVYDSPWSQNVPLDINFYGTFFAVSAARVELKKMAWAVEQILENDLPMTPHFMCFMRRVSYQLIHQQLSAHDNENLSWFLSNIKNLCHQKRRIQSYLDRNLITKVVNLVNKYATREDKVSTPTQRFADDERLDELNLKLNAFKPRKPGNAWMVEVIQRLQDIVRKSTENQPFNLWNRLL